MNELSYNQLIVLLDNNRATMRDIDSKEPNDKTHTEQVLYNALFIVNRVINQELDDKESAQRKERGTGQSPF